MSQEKGPAAWDLTGCSYFRLIDRTRTAKGARLLVSLGIRQHVLGHWCDPANVKNPERVLCSCDLCKKLSWPRGGALETGIALAKKKPQSVVQLMRCDKILLV
jgi:hypothetical protein